jgi:hypothetical protein
MLIDSKELVKSLEREHEMAIRGCRDKGKRPYSDGLVDGLTRAILIVKMKEEEKVEARTRFGQARGCTKKLA